MVTLENRRSSLILLVLLTLSLNDLEKAGIFALFKLALDWGHSFVFLCNGSTISVKLWLRLDGYLATPYWGASDAGGRVVGAIFRWDVFFHFLRKLVIIHFDKVFVRDGLFKGFFGFLAGFPYLDHVNLVVWPMAPHHVRLVLKRRCFSILFHHLIFGFICLYLVPHET